ncbi:hypothetical protein LXA43DRAFT_1115888 [Ganoderma leucocontextum]|nr:hypothetical protein LXA43DRAFT_1115888 [Ganoderma leucocontextum]
MGEPIVFYDIPSNAKGVAWSPNTWKTRYSLNIKGLPYKTVWVEYPDIEPLCKAIGATAAEKSRDGSPLYTLPVIHDPNTGATVSDSAAIARYLDKTYPDTPRLIPAQSDDALVAAFEDAFWSVFPTYDFGYIICPAAYSVLREGSRPFFRRTRDRLLGKPEEFEPGSDKRAQHWAKTQEGVQQVAKWLEMDGTEKLFFMGDGVGITYADITVAGFFMWFKKCCGEDSQEWRDIRTWDDGRWGRFMEAFDKYEVIDVGEDFQL